MWVAFTEDAVRRSAKTVIRRKGWKFLVPGERINEQRNLPPGGAVTDFVAR